MSLTYPELEVRISAWAMTRSDVQAVIVVGSRARSINPFDEWSDLDLIIILDDPTILINKTDWLVSIAPFCLTFVETTADRSGYERRVLFEGGLDVDFVPIFTEKAYELMRITPSERRQALKKVDSLQRGFRFLTDKLGFELNLRETTLVSEPQTPSEEEFDNLVSDFWYHILWTAKKLKRHELWTVQGGLTYLRWHCILPLLMWHKQDLNIIDYTIWPSGRFLEQWADKRAVEILSKSFVHNSIEELWQGLNILMDLFSWLAPETASKFAYTYDQTAEAELRNLVKNLSQI